MSLSVDAELLRQLAEGLEQMQLKVAEADQQRLVCYIEMLHKWNKTHNLTAIRNPQQMVTRHLLDSLSIAGYLQGNSLLDVGSGAGLPGIPLAIIKPHLNVTLLDSVLKKTRFMLFAAGQLELSNVNVLHTRVEAMASADASSGRNPDEPGCEPQGFDMIVARAFSSIDKLCALTSHLLAPHGQILAMIGKPVEAENTGFSSTVTTNDGCVFSVTRSEKLFVPGENGQRNIVILQKR
jgi:16S rRNA (guanine527-N7)-methyltransferase